MSFLLKPIFNFADAAFLFVVAPALVEAIGWWSVPVALVGAMASSHFERRFWRVGPAA